MPNAMTLEALLLPFLDQAVQEVSAAISGAIAGEALRIAGGGAQAVSRGGTAPAATAKKVKVKTSAATAPAKAQPKAATVVVNATASTQGRGIPSFAAANLDAIVAAIKARPGQAPNAYLKFSKLNPKAYKNALKKLKADGRVRPTGTGRGTTYTAS